MICVWKFTFYNKYIVNRKEKFSPLQMAGHSQDDQECRARILVLSALPVIPTAKLDLLQRCGQNLAEVGQASETLYQAKF